MLDLQGKGFCIFGGNDSGKSTLASWILEQYGASAFIYDTLAEYKDSPYDRYCPSDRYDPLELEAVTRAILACRRYSLFIIDEANRFCPSKPAPLPQAIADLNDWRAHYGISVGYICRRPVQLNQDLTELSQYLFVFGLDGKNDIAYLNDLSIGLGDAVAELSPYHFIVRQGREHEIYPPVPEDYKTAKIIAP